MNTYHFRVYVGPTTVTELAARMRATAMPWQSVTIEGTEHIHYGIKALHRQAAETESTQWLHRTAMQAFIYDVRYLRCESKETTNA